MLDLLSIGDTVVDTFIPLTDAKVETENGVKMISMRFGDKIPVGQGVSMVAGNAANNAVGSARLGLKTAIYTYVGDKDDDQADDRIIAKFKKEGVSTRYVQRDPDLPSNNHVVLTYQGERTILIYHQPWKFVWPDIERAKWVYLTSLSPSFVEYNLYDSICRYLEQTGAKLAFQPGTFQIQLGLKKSAKLLSLSEIFFVNIEEAKILLGFDMGKKIDVKILLKKLSDYGPQMVVITDGGKGSYGYDGVRFWRLGIMPANLVEMTGAGDAYATATVAGLIHGKNLDQAMRWGAVNSASVVGKVGPQAGLLTYYQLQKTLQENKNIFAREL